MKMREDDAPKGLGIDRLAWELGNANKRLFIALIFSMLALIGTNLAWTIYFSSFATETVMIEADQECDGLSKAIIVGGDYGYGCETESKDN